MTRADRPNILVVISDTMRTGHLGCYGNPRMRTPSIDRFAAQAVRFNRAYPETLPTIPVRRALHTGRRCYPFRTYRPVRWDIGCLPGWQPMDNDEDTLAENLAAVGYQTGIVTDTLPYFAPGFNFTRGFWQWEFIRGQQQDRWRSPYTVPEELLARYGKPEELRRDPHGAITMHLANTAHVQSEEDTSTALIFRWAMQFLEDNRKGQPFYLLVDCFDPHEPWIAPEPYYRLYGDPNYQGRRILYCHYGPAAQFGYTPEEMAYVEAHYSGLVTLVDTWFGKLMSRLDELGLAENTAVFFTSDHGTNFCKNPRGVIGKPDDAMYPGVMHLPLLARLPGVTTPGATCDELLYNLDLTATLYDLAGARSAVGLDGQSLLPLLGGRAGWKRREYITCRYSHSLAYIDDQSWVLTNIDGQLQEVFDLESDPECQTNIAGRGEDRFARAWERLLQDAGGHFPDYRGLMDETDALGQALGLHPRSVSVPKLASQEPSQ